MPTWEFKSFRPKNPQDRFPIFGRFPIRRSCGQFIGTEQEALAFTRRACEHLRSKNVERVEAWASAHSEASDLPGSVTFRLRPHTGNRWLTQEGPLAHPGNFPGLDSAINHSLFRGTGKVCRIELLNAAGPVQWLVLVGQAGDGPYATGLTLEAEP